MATLYPIARPQQTPPQADIVFVHGLNPKGNLNPNHAFTTWGGTDPENPGWPKDLANALPQTQVWILEYDSSASEWLGTALPLQRQAKNVLDVFCNKELGERPLVFVSHSLGGLLVKQLLRHGYDRLEKDWVPIWEQTQLVVFFGTPHAGADLATLARVLSLALKSSASIADLQPHSAALENLAEFYRKHIPSRGIETLPYAEDLPMGPTLVVDATSANPGLSDEPIRVISANHNDLATLAKDRTPFDTIVRKIIQALKRAEEVQKKTVTPHQQLPVKASSEFTGRGAELAQLHEILTSGNAALTQPPALSGWGGVGKTQLAARYAEVYGNEHTGGVFWVRADATETLWESFLSIARQCAPECIVEEEPWTTALKVCDWLSERKGALIIFDNADTPEVTEQYRERLGQTVRVLLTTRASSIAGCTVVPVETFEPEVGAELLLKRAGLDTENTDAQAVARTLSKRLGGLALALDQAGRFVHGGGINALKEYIASFDAEKIFLLGQRAKRQQEPEKPRVYEEHVSVLTTYTLAMKRLEDEQQLAAMQLVRLLAYLAPEGTEDALLRDGAEALEEPLKTVIASPMRWAATVEVAAQLGLLQSAEVSSNDDNTIRFLTQHRLTREVAKELLTEGEQAVFVQQAVNVVAHVTPDILQTRWWEKSPLWPQWTEIVQIIQKKKVMTVETGYLLNTIALWWKYTGRYQKAEPLYRQALKIHKAVYGNNHTTVATSLNNLAALLRATGRYQEAESLYRQALKIFEAIHENEHPTVAVSLNNLGLLLNTMGRYPEAKLLHQQALKINISVYGDKHSAVATNLNNLAELLCVTGKYQEAEPLYRQALDIRQQQLGNEHPDVAISLNNIAILLKAMGRYQEAEPLYRQALDIRQRQLGNEHPAVATSLNDLAGLLHTMGRYQEAEPLYRQALDIDKAIYGEEHLTIATNLNNFAGLLYVTGRYQEAEPLYRQALDIQQRQLGNEHPDVAQSLNNLAELLRIMGHYQKAEPLHQQALDIRQRQFGNEHPDVAQSLNNLAELLHTTSRYSKAELLYRQALRINIAIYGKEHPNTAISYVNLGNLLVKTEKMTEGLPIIWHAVQVMQAHFPATHPSVQKAQALLNAALNKKKAEG